MLESESKFLTKHHMRHITKPATMKRKTLFHCILKFPINLQHLKAFYLEDVRKQIFFIKCTMECNNGMWERKLFPVKNHLLCPSLELISEASKHPP